MWLKGAFSVGTDLSAYRLQAAIYSSMMNELTTGRLSEEKFAETYIPRYLNDATDWPDEIFLVLDRVFAMSESLELDEAHRVGDDFARSPEELRESVVEAIAKLEELFRAP
jgi:hypothetical protein